MEKIKQTKSVLMFGSEYGVDLTIHAFTNDTQNIKIPMKSVFQVKRGLESYIQKFYRRKTK